MNSFLPYWKKSQAVVATSAWRLLILGLLSGFWFLLTFNAAAAEFSNYDKLLVFTLLTVGLAVQAAVGIGFVFAPQIFGAQKRKNKKQRRRSAAHATPSVTASPGLENALLTVFAAVNLFSLHVCFIVPFAALAGWVQFLFFLLALFVIFQCFQFCAASPRFAALVAAVAAVSFLYQAGVYALGGAPLPPVTQTAAVGQTTVADNVKITRFQKTPNVYFLSFDAMIPAALAARYLGIKTLPYQEFLTSAGFFRFKNAFSDGAATRSSLNRLLAFDPYYFQQLEGSGREYGFFTGQEPSPLLQIFKANGYMTGTYMRNDYMGATAGPHVDRYKRQHLFSLCVNHPTETAATFGFFGYCVWLQNSDWWKPWLGVDKIEKEMLVQRTRYVEFLLQDFADHLAAGGRHFFMAHILTPNHTPQTYDHRDPRQVAAERRRYEYNATHETPAVMKRILDFIAANDPQALVYIYSDHGDGLARFLNYDSDASDWSEEQTRFFIHDKYGILSAFYPPDACPQEITFLSAQRYVTNSMVTRQIIRCLAGGEDPFTEEIEYRLLPDFGEGYNYGYRTEFFSYHLKDYLYE